MAQLVGGNVNRPDYSRGTRTLAFQIGVDPLFDPQTTLILRVEADAEGFAVGLSPAHRAANPDAGKREQGERDLHRLAGGNLILAPHGHTTGADFLAGGGEPATVVRDPGNFRDYRDAHVAAEIVQHKHLWCPPQLLSRGTLQRLVEDG